MFSLDPYAMHELKSRRVEQLLQEAEEMRIARAVQSRRNSESQKETGHSAGLLTRLKHLFQPKRAIPRTNNH